MNKKNLRFSIDLRSSKGDLAFQFNPRIDENCVVSNTCDMNSQWDREQRSGAQPFKSGCRFEITFRLEYDRFYVDVDKKQIFEFAHRIWLQDISQLSVHGDVVLFKIAYSNLNKYKPL